MNIGIRLTDLSVIIPVLNEFGNIDILTTRLALLPIDGEYIFVDDGSTDGTRELLADLENKDKKFIAILNNERLGHMGSYLSGLKLASSNHVVIMDGDLQHPPESLLGMLKLLDLGYDIVVGSRYHGRYFIGNRDKTRGIISRVAELLLKLFIKECRQLSDPVSGFVGFRKDIVIPITSNMNGNKLLPFLIVANKKAKVGHIPYRFQERQNGESKIVSGNTKFVRNFLIEVRDIRKIASQYRK